MGWRGFESINLICRCSIFGILDRVKSYVSCIYCRLVGTVSADV